MSTTAAIATIVGILIGLGVLPFVGQWMGEAIAKQIADVLWERMRPRIDAQLSRSIAPIEGQLHVVVKAVGELQPNGGSSMKDQLAELHRVAYRLRPNRPDPPSGWPV